ncbi:MAG: ECF transporter S component [Clostridia bacterium]|nr:ECF transporter S component [Clostridia bacterium]
MTNSKSKISTKNLITAAMLTAVAYVLMLVSKLVPQVAGFLQYDLKDVAVVMGGFILGPLYTIGISLAVTFLEFLTASHTGAIGLLMNFISTVAFCLTASIFYYKKKTIKGAIIGLVCATVMLAVVMILWNYFVTPGYMKVPRAVVVDMLPTVFLPFNLVKGLLNSGITLIVYRPVVDGLRKAGLVEKSAKNSGKKKFSIAIIVGLLLLAICIPFLCLMMK